MKHRLDRDWTITSSADPSRWYPTTLPSTVLGTLIDAGVYPDPHLGTNLRDIPGQGPPAQNFSNHEMPEGSPFAVPWWYRHRLRVPDDAGPYLRLRFDAINYRAKVWLDGAPLGEPLVGAYRVFEMDITDRVTDRAREHVLAVEIEAPGSCDLALTWVDWNPSPPDKNMGIWRDVWLLSSGPIALDAPFVTTTLLDEGRARVVVSGDVLNLSDAPRTAVIRARLEGRELAARLELAPREQRRFEMPVVLEEARLWWPRELGEPALCELELEVHEGGVVSDRAELKVGLRTITSELTEHGHALYHINGKPLLIRGAGWATDLFLRRDPARDLAQLAYTKALHLNTIRFEGMLERADFLEECDREGLLVIAGWCCCDCWEKWEKWSPENHVVAAESLRSQIRRVRRHPSMLAWWYGSDFPPPAPVEQSYLDVLAEEGWPNPAQSSASDKPSELTGPSGLKMLGPYEYVPPGYWLEDTARGGAFGFATEICPGVAMPPIESLRRMLPADHQWPIDPVWDFHAGGQEFHTVGRFVEALDARYGSSKDADELAQLSQLVTYEGQRAMFEAYTRNKYRATGVVQWMLNNAWPSMHWHLFDYYLRPGGGFFGTRKACEPLHVMYASDDRTVVVTNQLRRGFAGLVVRIRVVGGAEQVIHGVSVEADGRVVVATLPAFERDVTFVDLRLETVDGRILSSNFYWLAARPDELDYERGYWLHTPTARHADLGAVRRLPTTELVVRARRDDDVHVELVNESDHLAFFVQLRLIDATGADVLPVVWSDNYVSLLPGDACPLRASATCGRLPEDVRVEVRGINVATVCVAAEPDGERQAVGAVLALDGSAGPARRLPRAETDRMIREAMGRDSA